MVLFVKQTAFESLINYIYELNKMDLFTIDTVGEHNLLVRGKNEDPTESTEDTEQIENIDDEDENEEDGEYEYFGK